MGRRDPYRFTVFIQHLQLQGVGADTVVEFFQRIGDLVLAQALELQRCLTVQNPVDVEVGRIGLVFFRQHGIEAQTAFSLVQRIRHRPFYIISGNGDHSLSPTVFGRDEYSAARRLSIHGDGARRLMGGHSHVFAGARNMLLGQTHIRGAEGVLSIHTGQYKVLRPSSSDIEFQTGDFCRALIVFIGVGNLDGYQFAHPQILTYGDRETNLAAQVEIRHGVGFFGIHRQIHCLTKIEIIGDTGLLQHIGTINGGNDIVVFKGNYSVLALLQQQLCVLGEAGINALTGLVKDVQIGLLGELDGQLGSFFQHQRQLLLLAISRNGNGAGGDDVARGIQIMQGHLLPQGEVITHVLTQQDAELVAVSGVAFAGHLADARAVVFGAVLSRQYHRNVLLYQIARNGHAFGIGVFHRQILGGVAVTQRKSTQIDHAVFVRGNHLNILQLHRLIALGGDGQSGSSAADLSGEYTLIVQLQIDDTLISRQHGGQGHLGAAHQGGYLTGDGQGISGGQHVFSVLAQLGDGVLDFLAYAVGLSDLLTKGQHSDDRIAEGNLPILGMGVLIPLAQHAAFAVLPYYGIGILRKRNIVAVFILRLDGDHRHAVGDDGDSICVATDRADRIHLVGLGGVGIVSIGPLVGEFKILVAVGTPRGVVIRVLAVLAGIQSMSV